MPPRSLYEYAQTAIECPPPPPKKNNKKGTNHRNNYNAYLARDMKLFMATLSPIVCMDAMFAKY